jgi:hypothetical protein
VAALLEATRQGGHRVDVAGSGETECADSRQALLQVPDWILSDWPAWRRLHTFTVAVRAGLISV